MKKKELNNNKVITIVGIILAGLLAIISIYGLDLNKKPEEPVVVKDKGVRMGLSYEKKFDNKEGYILLTSYEQYSEYFDHEKITEKDFEDHNYLFIQINYDECSESDLVIKDYKVKGDKVEVNATYTAGCGVCAPQYIYYLLEVEKKEVDYQVDIDYKATNKPDCPRDVAYKPMIYLYPEKEMDIVVKLGNKKVLTSSYPKYVDGWNVKAYPSGKLIDNKTGRELYGLYWEGNNHKVEVKEEGFVVRGEDTISFLEEKLETLGLTEREANEFIVYWLPKLEVNKYNYIRFETKEEIDNYMPLDINPKPDSIVRIIMNFKALDKKIKVKEQKLKTPSRTGFTVVEWGGSIIE